LRRNFGPPAAAIIRKALDEYIERQKKAATSGGKKKLKSQVERLSEPWVAAGETRRRIDFTFFAI
jgi:hypothetical protein